MNCTMLCLCLAGLCLFSVPPPPLSVALTAGRTPSNYYAICVRAGKTNVLLEWQPVESSRVESSPRAKRKENIIIITRRRRKRERNRERWSRSTERSRALWTLGSGWKVCCIVVGSRQLSLSLFPLSLCLTAVFPGCLRIFDFNANKPKPQRERERERE